MFSVIGRTESFDKTVARIGDCVARGTFAHVVSLNPENVVEALGNESFMRVCEKAEVLIADGAGVVWAAKILSFPCGGRVTGVDLMYKLVDLFSYKKIMFVGGEHGVAQKTLENLASKYNMHDSSWVALGDVDKSDPSIIDHVISEKPDLLFVAFGSPHQELWIEKNRTKLQGTICVGVGQGFDIASGRVTRAPRLCRAMGFEWLYRLITQPWRWKRQLRLFEFIYLVIRYRITRK